MDAGALSWAWRAKKAPPPISTKVSKSAILLLTCMYLRAVLYDLVVGLAPLLERAMGAQLLGFNQGLASEVFASSRDIGQDASPCAG